MRQIAATEPRKKAANVGNAEARRPRNHNAKKLTKTPNARATGRPHIERDLAIGARAEFCTAVMESRREREGIHLYTNVVWALLGRPAENTSNFDLQITAYSTLVCISLRSDHCSKFKRWSKRQCMRQQSIQKLSLKKAHDSMN